MISYIIWSLLILGLALLWQTDSGEHCIIGEEMGRIKASRQKIFETITDMPGYSKWHPGLGKIYPKDEKSNVHLGKEFTEIANLPQGEVAYTLTVSGHSPNSFFSFTTDSSLENVHEYRLDLDEPGVTAVTLRIVSRKRSYLFHYVAAPFLRHLFRSQVLQTLVNLRLLMDMQSPPYPVDDHFPKKSENA